MSDEMIPDRIQYGDRELSPEQLAEQPVEVFRDWMREAVESGVVEANAVCLCTVDKEGCPDGRIVLLKGIEDDGLCFYTNYGSRKGRQLADNPRASLVAWWEPLKRQVRISGRVERLSGEESDRYFETRPRDSQLGTWASRQSESVASREALVQRFEEADHRFQADVPRPEHWGGYRLVPSRFEFWQGRDNRLHDRVEFLRAEGTHWNKRRLMP